MIIIPSILVPTFAEFARQARRLEGLFDLIQIDVMDGKFVPNTSFPDVEKINDLKLNLNYELHLMVDHPLAELEKWAEVKNIARVIFHIEAKDDPTQVIAKIRGFCGSAGIAIKPETPLSAIEPYLDQIDVVLFMTVYPGQQGAKFLPEVGEKIMRFVRCHPRESGDLPQKDADSRFRGNDNSGHWIAVDGGINESNIAMVKSWGVDIFGAGSAISMAPDVKIAYHKLQEAIK